MLKDSNFADQMQDMLNTMIDASIELHQIVLGGDSAQIMFFLDLFGEMIECANRNAELVLHEIPYAALGKCCKSIAASYTRIKRFCQTNPEQALHKIEYELLPLIKETYQLFYFQCCVYPDRNLMNKYYEEERRLLYANHYIDQALDNGEFKYELSIVITAYNKLKYTKMCVESLLKYIPKDLNYELILVNHGSTDGTKEFFESVHPHKQLDIEVNGGGAGALNRIVEGEYFLWISNDVLVTKNAIQILLNCLKSDPSIAWAVPSTPNVSNLQSIPVYYKSLDEMYHFAENNNQPDPYRHEQRARLCNPIDIQRSELCFSSKGLCHGSYYISAEKSSFPDDKIALIYRRAGYKNILVKNAYCYHFGSITLKDEITKENEEKYYTYGRKTFIDAFGIDPWGTGMCFDPKLIKELKYSFEGYIKILGINCGIGSNPLKIKEMYKELKHNLDVHILNVTDNINYIDDLNGVSDEAYYVSTPMKLTNLTAGSRYHYIVWEDRFTKRIDANIIIDQLLKCLLSEGILMYRASITKTVKKRANVTDKLIGDWIMMNYTTT